ncbi:hypothetical protein MPHL43072_20515 [Mycolicibacterium phlei DSM 43072]|uniref:DUF3060 domain-containing protein n=2 Tax=Mycolicibacterium phlei TaxID=1771 RepID=A0A5N5V7C8_MYCPH|nr:DUF3060 domain-containing protein [Mycolicibacterium phlei]KXW64640.1 hypothetical protein MPHL43070_22385 [Mycolicibacterium phlei DSM 43070]KXW69962.1 hypothetical protein MPHL43072_20515 [Mycolicibacterium phlei DSM 43072]KAB7757781.1 hypothetical protein MPHL21000_06765 [Mycolicibacterium phlei DSM 43239 = CCUG 21000]KXW61338.1 hypothetical protein MPHL43239_22285 [Mycolicibacterium phlei DSM 43239 = CCUG 21000]KXW76680.1 hypothetical protein JL15_15555 [Mycolicibacterium phlei DSM 4307
MWEHLRMNPQDDPEERIRQLEQPLTRSGVELGAEDRTRTDTSALPPPVYDEPYQQPYGQSPYAAPPFGVAYPQAPRSGISPWLIFGIIGAVAVMVVAAIGTVLAIMRSSTVGSPTIGGSFDDPPSIAVPTWTMPSFPSIDIPTPDPDAPPKVAVAPAGGQYSIAGVENVDIVECNGAHISVSGVNNTLTLLGHCASVNVSGIENDVTVDSADRIQASGFDNEVVFHDGDPEISASGDNIVTRG